MFETVAPTAAGRPSRSALYEALTFSLFVHAIGGVIALGANLWQVSFPNQSPAAMVAFILEAPAPPPPPPPPPKPAQQPETIATKVKVPESAFLAPTVIPDQIPLVKANQLFTPVAVAVPNGVIGGVAGGVDDGVLHGVAGGADGGQIGGTIDSVGPKVEADGRVHIARDKKLPLAPMSQVYPDYPEDARIRGWEDELVVRYVIGKDGRVKEVTVVQAPGREMFVHNTLKAIRSWRFRPLMKDGAAQEVVHELTIYFRLHTAT